MISRVDNGGDAMDVQFQFLQQQREWICGILKSSFKPIDSILSSAAVNEFGGSYSIRFRVSYVVWTLWFQICEDFELNLMSAVNRN